jgi:radical SAM superfamily enzyme YgiQ (UPF0313 family)
MKMVAKNLRILLIDPPVAVKRRILQIPNMGLAYIGASLEEEGYEVKLIDLNANRLSKKQIKNILKKYRYDIYGIGCMIVAYEYIVYLSKIIKKYHPNSLIIAGNSVASSIPEILLKSSKIDIAVIGEGDLTVKEISKRYSENNRDFSDIAGIYLKKNSKIIKTNDRKHLENLDSLPMPALHLFNMKQYMKESIPIDPVGYAFYPINATRGCPFHCTFCYHAYQGYKVRRHSTERIIQEIKLIIQKYPGVCISFVDDNFTYSKKRLLEFCDALDKENLNITWQAASRVDVIDDELCKRMKETGCISLGFGIESGSQTILNNIKKYVKVEQAKNALLICKKYGIKTSCSLMLGNLGENYHTAMESYYFVKEIGWEHDFRFFLPIPYPKTEIFEYAKSNGLIKNELKLIKSFSSEDNELIRVNFSQLSDWKLLQLKRSLEKLLNKETKMFFNNFHLNRILGKLLNLINSVFMTSRLKKVFNKINSKVNFLNRIYIT